jgi:formylglycine-generating enzyme required for sulfatase activity
LAALALGFLAYSFWPRTKPAPGISDSRPSIVAPATAFDDTKAKAERGDTDAQSRLGVMYDLGDGVPKDSEEAVRWYRKAADKGNARGQWLLGTTYSNGIGVSQDSAEAAKWFRKAADQGNADAQNNLAGMFQNGEGVPKDSEEAVRWYRKAADQGNADAQCDLGWMYAKGEGVPKDSEEAVRWFRKAADQGDFGGQYDLGLMYEKGGVVPKDETEALAWWSVAAALGNDAAVKDRDALEQRLSPEARAAAQRRSQELLKEIEAAKARQAGSAAVDSSPPKSRGSGATISSYGTDEGRAWTISDLDLELVPIPAGEFTMGSPVSESGHSKDEGPQTRVIITRAFWLGKFEVTQGQWEALIGRNPSHFVDSGPGAPVENVSWTQAMEFCKKLTERERSAGRLPEGYEYTLPTEAQWEYACRAGTTGPYAGDLDAMAWYGHSDPAPDPGLSIYEIAREVEASEVDRKKMEVERKKIEEKSVEKIKRARPQAVWQARANAWGLYNMHGNVWEWCFDRYGNYPGGRVTDPTGLSSGFNRVRRGGSYDTSELYCRSAYRNGIVPNYRSDDLGFRLALAPAR